MSVALTWRAKAYSSGYWRRNLLEEFDLRGHFRRKQKQNKAIRKLLDDLELPEDGEDCPVIHLGTWEEVTFGAVLRELWKGWRTGRRRAIDRR